MANAFFVALKKDYPYAKLAPTIGEAESALIKDLKDRFRARIRVAPIVEILPPDLIQKINFPAQSRKPIKFIDERQK